MLSVCQVVVGLAGLWLLAFGIRDRVIASNANNPENRGSVRLATGSLTPKTWKFWTGLSLSTVALLMNLVGPLMNLVGPRT